MADGFTDVFIKMQFFLLRPVICMAEQQPREQRGEEESWGQRQRTRAWRQRQVNLQALWAGPQPALPHTAVNQEITFHRPSCVVQSCLLCTDSLKQPVKVLPFVHEQVNLVKNLLTLGVSLSCLMMLLATLTTYIGILGRCRAVGYYSWNISALSIAN